MSETCEVYAVEGGEASASSAIGALSGTSWIVIVGIMFAGWNVIVSVKVR